VASSCQHGSRPVAIILSTVFDFDIVFAAITATFLTVVYQSNISCILIDWFCLTAVMLAVVTLCFAIHSDCLIRNDKVATIVR